MIGPAGAERSVLLRGYRVPRGMRRLGWNVSASTEQEE